MRSRVSLCWYTNYTNSSTWLCLSKCLWRPEAVPKLQLSHVQFLGTPRETLYKSPLIFIKVKCYYVFNGEVMPTCKESTCPCDNLSSPVPSSVGRGWKLTLPFFPCKVSDKVVSHHLTSHLSPGSSGARHQKAALGRWGRTVAGFPTAVGQGPATLTQFLSAQCCPLCQVLGRRAAKLAATLREGMLLLTS